MFSQITTITKKYVCVTEKTGEGIFLASVSKRLIMDGQVLTACRTITSLQMAVMSIRHPLAKKDERERNLQEKEFRSVSFSLSLLFQHGLSMRSLLILDRETDA